MSTHLQHGTTWHKNIYTLETAAIKRLVFFFFFMFSFFRTRPQTIIRTNKLPRFGLVIGTMQSLSVLLFLVHISSVIVPDECRASQKKNTPQFIKDLEHPFAINSRLGIDTLNNPAEALCNPDSWSGVCQLKYQVIFSNASKSQMRGKSGPKSIYSYRKFWTARWP